MPIYEFACESCGEQFDKLMSVKDPAPPCPRCEGGDVRKLITTASFVLKGGGWYKDHYGLKSTTSKPAGDAGSGGGSGGGSAGGSGDAGGSSSGSGSKAKTEAA